MRLESLLLVIAFLFWGVAGDPVLRGQDQSESDSTEDLTTWTSAEGKVLKAEFVRMTDTSIVLKRLKDDREVTVPLSMLSIDSHLQGLKLSKPEAFSKPLLKAETEPALPEIPSLEVGQIAKTPFPSNVTLEQHLDIWLRELQAGNIFVFYHALTPRMQQDLDRLVVQGVDVLGPQVMVQIKSLMGNVRKIVENQKEFVLGLPIVASKPQLVDQIDKAWGPVSELVVAVTDQSLWEPTNFQAGKTSDWMARLSARLGPQMLATVQMMRNNMPPGTPTESMPVDVNEITYKILSQSANSAKVEMSVPDRPAKIATFRRIQNTWLPVELLDSWGDIVGKANETLQNMQEEDRQKVRKSVGAGLFTAVGIIGGLANASSQEQFNATVEQIQAIIPADAFESSSGLGGVGGGSASRGQPSEGSPGGRRAGR